MYIGPPLISPFSFTSRYLIASIHSLNLEVKPNAAEIHIHTSAPGPPETIAVATPTIFPVPIVAARAVVSAENGETSPSPLLFVRASLLRVLFSAYPRFLHVRNLVRIVRNIPVPTSRINITGPQTKSSIFVMIAFNCSILFALLFSHTTSYFFNIFSKLNLKCLGNTKEQCCTIMCSIALFLVRVNLWTVYSFYKYIVKYKPPHFIILFHYLLIISGTAYIASSCDSSLFRALSVHIPVPVLQLLPSESFYLPQVEFLPGLLL